MSDWRDFEDLLGRLAASIAADIPSLVGLTPSIGRDSHVKGASGFNHQIDVAIQSAGHVVLVECKCWRKVVGVEDLLVFIARTIDIREGDRAARVDAVFATTVGVSEDAARLAKHFKIDVGVVRGEAEFAIKIGNLLTVAVTENSGVKDSVEAEIVPKTAR